MRRALVSSSDHDIAPLGSAVALTIDRRPKPKAAEMSMRFHLSLFLVSPLLVTAVMTTSSAALAQDPAKPQPPAASPAPLPPPTSAQPAVVTPAPNQAAAAAPAPSAVPITATCQLGEHPGVDEAEAR